MAAMLQRTALTLGAAAVLVLLVWSIAFMAPGTREIWAITLDNARRGYIGVGVPGENGFDFKAVGIEPGDIVLGANPGNSWGHWTHAALYVGDGRVIDTLLRNGVHQQPVERFALAYQRAGVLKVNLPREVKQRAVAEALALQGRPFSMLAGRTSSRWFYCTKIVWYAYWRAGVDLDPKGGHWVSPDRFVVHPRVSLVASPLPPGWPTPEPASPGGK